MAHYFDDMFQRSVEAGVPHSPKMRRVRRSSTARSIGARSDFEDTINGADDDVRSTTDSLFYRLEREKSHEKEEADSHMHRYISDQLNRYKNENRENGHVDGDEYEAKA